MFFSPEQIRMIEEKIKTKDAVMFWSLDKQLFVYTDIISKEQYIHIQGETLEKLLYNIYHINT